MRNATSAPTGFGACRRALSIIVAFDALRQLEVEHRNELRLEEDDDRAERVVERLHAGGILREILLERRLLQRIERGARRGERIDELLRERRITDRDEQVVPAETRPVGRASA